MNSTIREIDARDTYAIRHEAMWPVKPLEFVHLDNDEEGTHFGLFRDSILLAVVSLFITGNQAQFRKLATKTSEQGNGYGTLLLKHLIIYVSNEKQVIRLWCNARVDKTDFYKKFGMAETSKTFGKAGMNYVIMDKFFKS
ncbi:MAG: GNAT family N-acetyltransferase [Maribacter sp.]|jgi:predicted GNAT family N-acyltransferase